MSQNERILAYLREHDGITPRQAYTEFGTLRLAARISELRAQGHVIVSDRLHVRKGTTVALYRLPDSPQGRLGL